MNAQQHPPASRRHAIALAAALTATVLTAVAAVGGLSRSAQQPAASSPVVHVLPRQSAPPAQELDD